MKSAAALMAIATSLVVSSADATTFRHPSTCHSGCMVVTAYYDHGGVKDWNCGSVSYSGHKGTDFAPYGGFTAMDEGRDIVAAAAGEVIYTHDGEFDRCTSGSCAGGSGFGNWVRLRHADGKETSYGHMKKGSVAVSVGQMVTCGQKLGQIGSSGYSTGAHLHFEPRIGGTANDPFKGTCSSGTTFWVSQGAHKSLPGTTCEATEPPPPPPNKEPKGNLDSADCTKITGWAQDPDAPTKAIDVHLYFDGEAGSGAKGVPITANVSRADLCGPLGSCEHAFEYALPDSFRDGKPHTVFAYGIDTAGGTNPKLAGSPKTFTCTQPTPDAGAPSDAGPADDAATVADAAVTPAPASDPSMDDDGTLQGSCGCRAAGATTDSRAPWLLALFGLVAVRRRLESRRRIAPGLKSGAPTARRSPPG